MNVNLSFGLEYECALESNQEMDVVRKEFDKLLSTDKLHCYSLSPYETSFRLLPGKTDAIIDVMKIFNKYYSFNDSTTHIHADATSHWHLMNIRNLQGSDKLVVLSALKELTEYKVKGQAENIKYNEKGNMVNLRSAFKTIEYRCFPVTFNADLLLHQLNSLYIIHGHLINFLKAKAPYIERHKFDDDIVLNRKRKIE